MCLGIIWWILSFTGIVEYLLCVLVLLSSLYFICCFQVYGHFVCMYVCALLGAWCLKTQMRVLDSSEWVLWMVKSCHLGVEPWSSARATNEPNY